MRSMDLLEQRLLGKMIIKIIKKEVGNSFSVKYQGPREGKVVSLVIACGETSQATQIKNYLWSNFNIAHEKINGHGSGGINTVIVKISELKSISVSKIREEFNVLFPEKKDSKKKVQVSDNKNEFGCLDPDEAEIHEKARRLSLVTKGRISISARLHELFDFENSFKEEKYDLKSLFSYDEDRDESLQTINCLNEQIASCIEKELQWFIGDKSSALRSDYKVMVNFSIMNLRDKKPAGVNFCLAPSFDSDLDVIRQRLLRVLHSSVPSISQLNDHSFRVLYSRLNTASKIFGFITDMGWNAEYVDGCIIVDTNPLPVKEKIVSTILKVNEEVKLVEIAVIPVVKEEVTITPIVKEEISVTSLLEEVKEIFPKIIESIDEVIEDRDSFPSVVAHNLVDSKEEAIHDLNLIFLDHGTFNSFSKETQEKIVFQLKKSLKEEMKRDHPEEFVKYLLSYLEKN